MATRIFTLRTGHGMNPAQVAQLEQRIDGFLMGVSATGRNVVGMSGTEPNFAGAARNWRVLSEQNGVWQVEIF